MFKLKTVSRALQVLAAAGVMACAAMPVAAQNFMVANSTGGYQVAAAPINQIVANLNNSVWNAQNTANNATSTANFAVAVGNNAQATANWAGDVASNATNTANNANNTANNAWNTANAIAGRVDATWNLGMADCRLALGGDPFNVCGINNPRPW